MVQETAKILQERGISPSSQRVAVATYVLTTDEHPSADEVWSKVRASFPQISRATVYNTLNLFVEKGLLRRFALTEGRVVFDPRVDDHHHFIDEATGSIYDVPWDALEVTGVEKLKGVDVERFQVVLHGKKKGS